MKTNGSPYAAFPGFGFLLFAIIFAITQRNSSHHNSYTPSDNSYLESLLKEDTEIFIEDTALISSINAEFKHKTDSVKKVVDRLERKNERLHEKFRKDLDMATSIEQEKTFQRFLKAQDAEFDIYFAWRRKLDGTTSDDYHYSLQTDSISLRPIAVVKEKWF